MDQAIKLSLETWYPEGHPLHLDPLHPAIGLAGEAGKLLNLYKKERFKGDFSWGDCIHCGHNHKGELIIDTNVDLYSASNFHIACDDYIPKILDGLGDFWYYLRILAWQQKIDLSEWTLPKKRFVPDDMFMILARLNLHCAKLLLIYEDNEHIEKVELATAFSWFQDVLFLLDCTLDQLTEQNYDKLNNGWQATLENNL